MAIFRERIVVQSANQQPTMGTLIGTRVSDQVFESIESAGYKSFFGSDFDHMTKSFFERYVDPIDSMNKELSLVVNRLLNPDHIRILNTIDDFKSIPLSMELPILLYAPVRQAFMSGEISGFGYIPDSLPEEDVFGRLLDNFYCEDVEAASDENGVYKIEAILESDDPILTDDELYAIRETREFIRDHILAKTDRDPTDIESPRG